MADGSTAFLMYHELAREGRPLCRPEKGYARYAVQESSFRQQLDCIARLSLRGVAVSQALSNLTRKQVALTFDDGCETDLLIAAPLLQERNWNATFFITAGYTDKPGYLTSCQARELSSAGFEIGCHSMSHPYLDELNDAGLKRETVDAKLRLEDIIGSPVQHFSAPGGRLNPRVRGAVRQAGYASLCTSRIGFNSTSTDPFQLARVPVLRSTSLSDLECLLRGKGLLLPGLRQKTREIIRACLGNRAYDALRTRLLGDSSE